VDFASSGVIAIMGLKSPAENESSQIYGIHGYPVDGNESTASSALLAKTAI
jgi:hypothetical protein